jgi:hypothetical protein
MWKWQHKHIVSIGGGVSSTLELPFAVLDKYGADNTHFVIACLKGESPDLWRMVDWLEQKTGKTVTRLAWHKKPQNLYYGMPARHYQINPPAWAYSDIWDVFNHVGMMGNSLADPCSRVLKREILRQYTLDFYDPATTVMHVGITAGEIDRMLAIQRNWSQIGVAVEADLADTPIIGTSAERANKLLGWIPNVYEWGSDTAHNNCGGFCIKAGHGHMARYLWFNRELYLYHENREIDFQITHNTSSTIMRDLKTVKGIRSTTPLTLRDFRLRMETRWNARMPGFEPFEQDNDTGCHFCEAA